MRYSVALSTDVESAMRRHLIRDDGQEDVLAASYVLSTGRDRTTAIIRNVIVPTDGDRHIHGTASFTSRYILRAANEAQVAGHGLVLLHSHPNGTGWQALSTQDHETESEYERAARAITGLPLLGMTLAGSDTGWSARIWFERNRPTWAESVRSVGSRLCVTWNDGLRPAPRPTGSQDRTISAWGLRSQASIARLRVLVVGGGSVGLDIAQRIAATGLTRVGVMDYDAVETVNLDRMIGATRLDAALGRAKVDVAARLMTSAATAEGFTVARHEVSITDPLGAGEALDYDVIFSCVDRPWARAVLNSIAYADMIPVIDGGIALDTFPDGRMRGGIWRAHTLVPGLPCMVCLGQLDLGELALDRRGLLEDPAYITTSGRAAPGRQNVAALSASVSAALLAQFVSLTAHPGGLGASAPLRYLLGPHELEHSQATTGAYCPYENEIGEGDGRTELTEVQDGWRNVVANRQARRPSVRLRSLAMMEYILGRAVARL